jgi:phosphatidylinositol glycan class U
MFDSFRSFFLCVFQLHLLIYVAPLCIRLQRNPLAICTTLLGVISIFKSYPSVADLALYLGMLSLHVDIFGSKIPSAPAPRSLTSRDCLNFILGVLG